MRVLPSIAEATGPVDSFLANLRLPYELPYVGPHGTLYRPVEVEPPNRNLPVAHITEVTKMIYYL